MRRSIAVPAVVGIAGLAVGFVELARDPTRALYAYLAAFVFTAGVSVGALVFVMIAYAARARWFVVLRRLAMAIASTTPLLLVFFAPIAIGVHAIYPWAHADRYTDPETVHFFEHQRAYMNVPLFVVRSYACILAWSALAILLRRTSIENDARPSERLVARERFIAGLGLPIAAITITVAAFDWIMPLEPRFMSDMLGVYLFASAFAAAVGTLAIVTWLARRDRVLPDEVGPSHFHALGRVLLVGVIFWSYIAFCQLLLVWIADLPREAGFYAARVEAPWNWISGVLVVVGFVVPFLALLSRPLKRRGPTLALAGAWLVGAHALDAYWLVLPSLHRGASFLDVAFFFGLAGLASAFGAWRFFAAAPYPTHDPSLAVSLRYESP